MDWEEIGLAVGRGFLLLLEYCFKVSATVVAFIIMGTKGSFGSKLAAGFSSLSPALRSIFETPEKVSELTTIVRDYNTLTAAVFNERYGIQAINSVFDYLNEGILYFQAVYQNLINQPLATVCATAVAFFVLYLLARVLRFARQKGQGSFFTRLERRLGDRVFQGGQKTHNPMAAVPRTNQQPRRAPSNDKSHIRKKIYKSKIRD